MFFVTYVVDVCFKEILMSAAWKWRHNSAETCSSYVKDCTQNL